MNSTTRQDSLRRHRLATSLVVVATAGGLDVVLKVTLVDLLSLHWSVLTNGIISGFLAAVLGAVALSWLGVWRDVGLKTRPVRA